MPPRTTSFPPTPAPSTDITAKSSATVAQLDSSFALPPAAIANSHTSSNTRTPTSTATDTSSAASNASDSSYRPLSPASPVATSKKASSSRKRAAPGTALHAPVTSPDYSLPPPPTRSRKIIQMKPRDPQQVQSEPSSSATAAKPNAAPPAAGKRKQASNTTAAGRKIARKTAHSLIERRRRSKMNEEFGVLKDMIPACAGQEMHKLAILQASIEYMRYLQQCVDELKEAHRSRKPLSSTAPSPYMPHTEPSESAFDTNNAIDQDDEDNPDDEDEDMSDAVSPKQASVQWDTLPPFTNASPAIYPSDRSIHSTTTSPNLGPNDIRNYSVAMSPALQASDPHRYSLGGSCVRSTATSPSMQPSPAFGGQTPSQSFNNPFSAGPSSKNSVSGPSGSVFALTSPALGPQADREDHEATEALLMLNTDRRSWTSERNTGGRGMSVRDLLSG
ncbi:unnamed protein product [Periconia digitata]|uniref:BHLH domain-containing protein n=1 Tax=Periconia digitata TaxID=1303443 RepID=A0A9W4XJV0_9PLEO|nr:unnamed protein product [Periconia digitata]